MHDPHQRRGEPMDVPSARFVGVGMRVLLDPVRVPMFLAALLNQQKQSPNPQKHQRKPDGQLRVPLKGRVQLEVKDKDERPKDQYARGVPDRPAASEPGAFERIRLQGNKVGDGRDMVPVEGVAHAEDKTGQQQQQRLERHYSRCAFNRSRSSSGIVKLSSDEGKEPSNTAFRNARTAFKIS